MDWIDAKQLPSRELKGVLAWAEGATSSGYCIAYIEKSQHTNEYQWWDVQSDVNSNPIKVLYWRELPDAPKAPVETENYSPVENKCRHCGAPLDDDNIYGQCSDCYDRNY